MNEAVVEEITHIEKQEEKPKTPPPATIIPIGDDGHLTFSNAVELRNAASIALQTRLVPDNLKKEGIEAIAAAMMVCKQYNLPQKAMNQMAFIKGRITCYGSLVTALAERHPAYGEKREFFLDKEQNRICSENKNLNAEMWAAVVQIKKKGADDWNEYFFTMEDAKKAGIIENVWKTYPKDMAMHKARKRALNAEYASSIEGIEYHEDLREVYETTNAADEINRTFGEKSDAS